MRSTFLAVCALLALPSTVAASEPLVHTYSVVARDPDTGSLGVAVQSHWFQVGTVVPWAEPGVGAIATQALTNAAYGPRGLALLRQGKSPEEVVRALTADDAKRENRQLIVVDAKGRVAGYTGKRCIPAAGHALGQGFAVAANLMRDRKVWPAMARAFRESKGALAERLLAALRAAQGAGGDLRGQQSAALLVLAPRAGEGPWTDRLVDLRVADHARPLQELSRLLRLRRGYQAFAAGEAAVAKGDVEEALRRYREARRLAPRVVELSFWQAHTLFRAGEKRRALGIFRRVLAHPELRAMLRRLPGGGLLTEDEVQEILRGRPAPRPAGSDR
jgi:uncharacterized Ntn-hydrolase superfamily protein